MSHQLPPIDAVLLLSFGGPEGPGDVVPFLENVTRGRNLRWVSLKLSGPESAVGPTRRAGCCAR
jgi:ferrochelatase